MRRINRKTGKLSGNWKRYLKKAVRWNDQLHCPMHKKDLPEEKA